MKPLIIVLIIFILGCGETKSTDNVLICTGRYSKAYHKDYSNSVFYCKGLRACKGEINRVERSKIQAERRACGYCW